MPSRSSPGRHLVRISSSYLWEYGGAEQLVDIGPGQTVTVHYSPPLVTFLAGRIGFEPQPRPGLVALVLILAVPVVVLILLFAASLSGRPAKGGRPKAMRRRLPVE